MYNFKRPRLGFPVEYVHKEKRQRAGLGFPVEYVHKEKRQYAGLGFPVEYVHKEKRQRAGLGFPVEYVHKEKRQRAGLGFPVEYVHKEKRQCAGLGFPVEYVHKEKRQCAITTAISSHPSTRSPILQRFTELGGSSFKQFLTKESLATQMLKIWSPCFKISPPVTVTSSCSSTHYYDGGDNYLRFLGN